MKEDLSWQDWIEFFVRKQEEEDRITKENNRLQDEYMALLKIYNELEDRYANLVIKDIRGV